MNKTAETLPVKIKHNTKRFNSVNLPDEPFIKIRPHQNGFNLNFTQIRQHRELLYLLIWRDLKVRYKQTILGASWVILQPLLMTLVFTIFLGNLVNVPTDNLPYPLFVYVGLVTWTFFATSISASSYSLISNSFMITKVYFPRLIIPLATVGVRVVDFLIALAILIVFMFYYSVDLSWNILLFPLLILQTVFLTIGLGIWLSVMTAKYRDVGTVLAVILQLWMFASPIVYPTSLVPDKWRLIYALNPFVGIIEGMRASLFGLNFDWTNILISLVITLILLVFSVYSFQRVEDDLIYEQTDYPSQKCQQTLSGWKQNQRSSDFARSLLF
jgi:lipopolysaccharide transport system permease protein